MANAKEEAILVCFETFLLSLLRIERWQHGGGQGTAEVGYAKINYDEPLFPGEANPKHYDSVSVNQLTQASSFAPLC